MTKNYIIITSINEISLAVKKFSSKKNWSLILVGDRKGPAKVDNKNIIFLDINKQYKLNFSYVKNSIENHYSRKNIGYLFAMSKGANIIAESDDDNIPYGFWGKDIRFQNQNLKMCPDKGFFNAYKEFSNEDIWPRGFPLELIANKNKQTFVKRKCDIGVWQELADLNPDVDAIYRLTHDKSIKFIKDKKMALDNFVYCPFNSQNTFWHYPAFMLLYLPQTVTFRYTDILRGYIAQRLLWECNLRLGFKSPSVKQKRNEHNLINDFRDEIPMYLHATKVVELLNSISLRGSLSNKLMRVYSKLVELKIVEKKELTSLESWIKDIELLKKNEKTAF